MQKSRSIFFFFCFLYIFIGSSCSTTGKNEAEQISVDPSQYDVRILRDCWGVPHIYGAKDTDVAFGLAYAHSEDDFETIQDVLLASRGQLATVYGRKVAPNDYLVRLLRVWDVVNEKYESDLSPETRALCEAYADGFAYYASLHPEKVKPGVLPVTGKDLVAGFVYKVPLFFRLDRTLAELYGKKRKYNISARIATHAALPPGFSGMNQYERAKATEPGSARSYSFPGTRSTANMSPFPKGIRRFGAICAVSGKFLEARNHAPDFSRPAFWDKLLAPAFGSNTFAVSPRRSAGGETFLAVNSHQPWEGPVSWYEVHLHSDEGWDTTGGLFPGSPVILHGHNRHLGWASTVNWPDLADVYVLDINPENPNQYLFDGEWRELEVRKEPIKVKLFGPISINSNQEFLWSVYGPVVRRPHGTYAIRYAGMGNVRQVEQWYRMNKAKTLDEWLDAMRIMSIPMFNFGYADAKGNIYYLYNGLLPERVEFYDWTQYLPGNTSETLWTSYLPFDSLPQILNPASGFIQNCNSSPYQTTTSPENPRITMYSPVFNIETKMTNRSLRALELFGGDESITEEEFYKYKFDLQYSEKSDMTKCVREILAAPPSTDPVVREALETLRSWDLRTNAKNTGAAIGVLSVHPVLKASNNGEEPPDLLETFVKAAHELKRAHGRVDVPWSEVNRICRGKLDLGLSGGPDVLHAVTGECKKGRITGTTGDSYILMVTWDADGEVHSRSIHQYGSATLDEQSPHYADQTPLFVQCKLKPVWLDEADIRAHLEREYRPGEELAAQ
jgi:acyl-homoserine lactone acylase PvdQ